MKHLEILTQLNNIYNANFYLVGGFVRDMLAGIKSEDYDIATDLHPQQILDISEQKNIKAKPTGIKHGTVTVFLENKALEITTFRKDFENNGRHATVKFTKSIKEDSIRRDFTFNAIYQDSTGKIYDFHNGQNDLKKGRVKFIGKPAERINEDYLRVLRFFRFFADFDNGGISVRDEALKKALHEHGSKVKSLSADRITQEFLKLSISKNYTKGFACLASFENLANIFNLDARTCNSKDLNITQNLSPFTKLALLYRNNLQDLLANSSFNFSNKQKQFVKSVLKTGSLNLNEDNIIYNAVKYGKEVIDFILVSQYLNGDLIKLELLEMQELINANLPVFKVTGADLIKLGFKADKSLGEVLSKAKNHWLENNFLSKQKCLDFIKKEQ